MLQASSPSWGRILWLLASPRAGVPANASSSPWKSVPPRMITITFSTRPGKIQKVWWFQWIPVVLICHCKRPQSECGSDDYTSIRIKGLEHSCNKWWVLRMKHIYKHMAEIWLWLAALLFPQAKAWFKWTNYELQYKYCLLSTLKWFLVHQKKIPSSHINADMQINYCTSLITPCKLQCRSCQ